jgi:PAS domain S-box-containing protein/diguanylate cyclase (GGDEF)-like protein
MVHSPEDPEIYRNILDSLDLGVYLVDPERRITFWNVGAERITGYSRSEVLGAPCYENMLVHCCEAGQVQCSEECPLKRTLEDGQPRHPTLYLRHKKGHRVPVHVKTVVLRDRLGSIVGAAEFFGDQFLAETASDGQSGFASLEAPPGARSREHLEACLTRNLEAFARDRQPFGILALHVDQWQNLRVTRGREAAEAAIRVIAETLLYSLHPADVFGRWSDEEFLVIVRDRTTRALELDADLLRNLAKNAQFRWWGDRVSITISAGGALVRAGDTDKSMRLRAGAELKRSIERGGDRVAVAEEEAVFACLP